MNTSRWTRGEVAVIGLGKSGSASCALLRSMGASVYASDAGNSAATRERAAQAEALGVAVDVGRHNLDRIARASIVVASPGVPPDAAPLVHARAAHVDVVSEVELGLSAMPDVPYIAITGTNGKTTVTAMVAHLLQAIGHTAEAVGNIGTPVCDVARRSVKPAWMSLEISSFQLHDTPSIRPVVGVLTNLAPDHLDRYPGVEAYYADKALLFRHADSRSRWVVNADDAASLAMTRDLAGVVAEFSAAGKLADAFLDKAHDTLVARDTPLVRREELRLLGAHNAANALTAALAVMLASPAHESLDAIEKLRGGLRSFRALPHRLEPVGEYQQVLWINDSKATNVASARVALESMTRPTVLLLGGRHKGEPYRGLVPAIAAHCYRVLAYGEAADTIMNDLSGHAPVERIQGGFDDVLRRAHAVARPGDVVLLSPACASYDMFNNYEERGRAFAEGAARPEGHR